MVRAGALQWLLDAASEQEQKEMLLAYWFLWDGFSAARTVTRETAKHRVDAAIERFLSDDILLAEGGDTQVPPGPASPCMVALQRASAVGIIAMSARFESPRPHVTTTV